MFYGAATIAKRTVRGGCHAIIRASGCSVNSTDLPERFCEICGAIHLPPIHDYARCHPGKYGGRVYFTAVSLDPQTWPTQEEMQAALAYWDAVLADKGTKPLS